MSIRGLYGAKEELILMEYWGTGLNYGNCNIVNKLNPSALAAVMVSLKFTPLMWAYNKTSHKLLHGL